MDQDKKKKNREKKEYSGTFILQGKMCFFSNKKNTKEMRGHRFFEKQKDCRLQVCFSRSLKFSLSLSGFQQIEWSLAKFPD